MRVFSNNTEGINSQLSGRRHRRYGGRTSGWDTLKTPMPLPQTSTKYVSWCCFPWCKISQGNNCLNVTIFWHQLHLYITSQVLIPRSWCVVRGIHTTTRASLGGVCTFNKTHWHVLDIFIVQLSDIYVLIFCIYVCMWDGARALCTYMAVITFVCIGGRIPSAHMHVNCILWWWFNVHVLLFSLWYLVCWPNRNVWQV